MEYQKPVMSITEHGSVGFSVRDMKNDVHVPGQKFAWKTSGGGKWMIDVREYEKFRNRHRRR